MFPFKKKLVPVVTPIDELRDRVNKRLDDTHTRLEEVVREMKRRLEDRERKALSVAR